MVKVGDEVIITDNAYEGCVGKITGWESKEICLLELSYGHPPRYFRVAYHVGKVKTTGQNINANDEHFEVCNG